MFDYLVQNFNLVSFSLGMSAALILTALGQALSAYAALVRANRRAREAQQQMAGYEARLKERLTEIEAKLAEKGKKADGNK